MEFNIVNQVEFDVSDTCIHYFEAIIKRVETLLHIKENYCFSMILVNDEQIHEINREYRNIDRPTDVISFALLDSEDDFEMVEDEIELGDIFINIDAISRQSESYGHSFDREFCFLLTHGILHLLGYDHMSEEDEKKMFAMQDEVLNEIITR